jgi:hypothetical protein
MNPLEKEFNKDYREYLKMIRVVQSVWRFPGSELECNNEMYCPN